MAVNSRLFLGAVVLAAAVGCPRAGLGAADAGAPQEDVSAVVGGNNAFALDLYARLRGEEGNLFFSPYSISTALAMTCAGARGETAAQMQKALRFSLPEDRLHPAFAALARGLKPRGCELNIANRLWGQAGYAFLDPFLKVTEDCYGAKLEQLKFAGGTEAARQRINAWVERKTKERIIELIKPGILDALTRLVLTNAIYFKGDWARQFKKDATRGAPFTLRDGGKVRVPMMYQKAEFAYARHGGLHVLDLPYAGEELSMFVLLPDEVDGLPGLARSLSLDKLKRWLRSVHEEKVQVYLPKFKMTSEFQLNRVLASMGMPFAFDAVRADFSGMDGTRSLFISKVIHKAFVEVNEEGTEAAAATAVVMRLRGAPMPAPVFRADHPFLFLIRDNRSGSILFFGRVVNPLG